MSEETFVKYDLQSHVAVITLDNPPVNALNPVMREQIIECIKRANADDDVTALLLIGAGNTFVAGADIRRFGAARSVSTRVSAAALEASQKPVVAAMQGYALGGGLEHALACHFRLASPAATFGFPEVKLGLMPGGGGTQRLPRLIGPERAIDLIVSARNIDAQEALSLGLIDEVVTSDDFQSYAIRYALQAAANGSLPRISERTDYLLAQGEILQLSEALQKAVKNAARQSKAPDYVVSCV